MQNVEKMPLYALIGSFNLKYLRLIAMNLLTGTFLFQEIDKLEGYRKKNQERQRKFIATLILYSILTYILGALVFYFYFFPEKWKERFLYSLPLLVFPLM